MVLAWHLPLQEQLLARKAQLPHALLFWGPEGIGKLACAEALVRALLCEDPRATGAACGRCVACGWMGQGNHPDFRRLEPEFLGEQTEPGEGGEKKGGLQIQVAQVRSLADFINLSSHRGGAKVVLIHPAETLNVNAANALLKNLEEPPPRTYFVLVAHRWHQLLPTLRSRCQHIAMPPPAAAEACAWLEAQGSANPELALDHAGGAPLLALKFDGEYWRQRELFLAAIARPDFDPLRAAEELRDCAPALAVGWLQKWAFDLVCHEVTGRVRYNPDLSAAIAAVAARLDVLATLRFQREMATLRRSVAHPLNPRLFLEQLLLMYAALLRNSRFTQAA